MSQVSEAVVIFSGGLDSTTLLYYAIQQSTEKNPKNIHAISFDYGQRHAKELVAAIRIAADAGVQHDIIDISILKQYLAPSGSSLVSGTDVPDGHYAQENMKATVVPNRNMIMLSIAGGIAVAEGAEVVLTAVHAGDHFIYPDCRPEFIRTVSLALQLGNEGFGNLQEQSFLNDGAIVAPFIDSTKAQIAKAAFQMNVPVEMTWSCYKGGDKHCGRCGTCVERAEAIHEALAELGGAGPNDEAFADPTEYEDSEYWKTVTKSA